MKTFKLSEVQADAISTCGCAICASSRSKSVPRTRRCAKSAPLKSLIASTRNNEAISGQIKEIRKPSDRRRKSARTPLALRPLMMRQHEEATSFASR